MSKRIHTKERAAHQSKELSGNSFAVGSQNHVIRKTSRYRRKERSRCLISVY